MTANTGLLTQRCDPYGAESRIQLMGGIYPESRVGRIMWHCKALAAARYTMVCTGGSYGYRTAADGGPLPAFECPGGHKGQPVPLCADHRRQIAKRQAGLCPACVSPPQARELMEAMETRQRDQSNAVALGYYVAAAKLGDVLENLQGQMNELLARGIVHRCPLRLEEVS